MVHKTHKRDEKRIIPGKCQTKEKSGAAILMSEKKWVLPVITNSFKLDTPF